MSLRILEKCLSSVMEVKRGMLRKFLSDQAELLELTLEGQDYKGRAVSKSSSEDEKDATKTVITISNMS